MCIIQTKIIKINFKKKGQTGQTYVIAQLPTTSNIAIIKISTQAILIRNSCVFATKNAVVK